MNNCIFGSGCIKEVCDKSCPVLVETSYLLERNDISMQNQVFCASRKEKAKTVSILRKASGKLCTVISDNTIKTGTLLTYCAVCENWQGNRLHCNVYHLRFSNHLDSIQQSWSAKDIPEQLEYEQIWTAAAKILIISNLDFVQFKDFQAQTLLNIIHNRMNKGLTTIIVCPKLTTLIGSGMFYQRLLSMLGEAVLR
ncbi:MAG: hypothetical protein NC320_01740 [Clostridium sp.]|nr:hypothetical protein [Clostridium sp.]